MGWIITKNHLDSHMLYGQGRDGTETIPFCLYDDDGRLYFEGLISESWLFAEAEVAFAPLDTLQAEFGCTCMTYYEDDEWHEL